MSVDAQTPPAPGADALLIVIGLGASGFAWWRLTRGQRDFRLGLIYFLGLFGALAGAKAAFLLAEGWFYRGDWVALVTGRSITGAILGGYAGVEWGKRSLGYTRTTGDLFAIVVPLALAIGRVHCVVAGCCPGVECGAHWWAMIDADGVARWPAVWVEMGFNLAFLGWAVAATRWGWQKGNRFHVYMVAYGMFRFAHEFARDDHRILGSLTGYHLLAAAVAGVGAWRWVERRGARIRPEPGGSSHDLCDRAGEPAGPDSCPRSGNEVDLDAADGHNGPGSCRGA